jgi:hypothetical protein
MYRCFCIRNVVRGTFFASLKAGMSINNRSWLFAYIQEGSQLLAIALKMVHLMVRLCGKSTILDVVPV